MKEEKDVRSVDHRPPILDELKNAPKWKTRRVSNCCRELTMCHKIWPHQPPMIHRRCVCIYSRSLLFFLTHRQLLLATAKLLLLLFMTRYTQRRQRQCSISNLTPVGFEHSNNRNGQNSFQNDGGFQQREDSFSFSFSSSSKLKQVRKKESCVKTLERVWFWNCLKVSL